MKTGKILAIALFSVALIPAAFAKVNVARYFANNMVLQREAPVIIWGTTTKAGEEVTVSFAGQTVKAVSDKDRNWEVHLAPLAMQKEGSEMTIQGENKIVLNNILVGDVWLCSGQSNMEWLVNNVTGEEETIREAEKYPLIRAMMVNRKIESLPLQDIPIRHTWKVCTPDMLKHFSAVGYYFARRIHMETGVPIGFIHNAWSACPIENYMSPDSFNREGLKEQYDIVMRCTPGTDEWVDENKKFTASMAEWCKDTEKACQENRPVKPLPVRLTTKHGGQFNAMIAPMARIQLKGIIWYQGCANAADGMIYYTKMHALVESWRKNWGKELPFYFVQLASWINPTDDPEGGNGFAPIREVQRKAMDIPKSGMACAIDIGMPNDIHPKNKFDVGERLAVWALHNEYGKKEIVVSGPLFKAVKFENGKAIVSFDYAKGLMTAKKDGISKPVATPGEKPKHFAIAGADKKWVWADAVIVGETVVLSSPEVKEPVAVRFAYRGTPAGFNMYNGAGLPMVPFRTDNWEEKK